MLKLFKKWKKYLIFFVLVLLLSFTLRFAKVVFEKQPVFGDEAIYVRWSQVMRAEPTLRFIPLTDGKQPLYMWVTIPFLKIFDDPLIAGRMLTVYTGVITTAGVIFLALLLFKSQKTAFSAGLIYALSPYTVFFDSMALADSMLSMFGIWSLVFAVLTVRQLRLDTAMLSGFTLGGALLTKSPAIFFVALLPLTILLQKWPRKTKDIFKSFSVYIFLFTFTYAIAFAIRNILKLGPNSHMIAIRNQDYVYPLGHLFVSPFDPLTPFLKMILEYLWFMGPGIILILFILGAWVGLKKYKKETLILSAWGILPLLAVAEFSKTMTARYIYFSIPYLFIISSLCLLQDLKGKGLITKLVLLGLIVFIGHSLFLDFQLITNPQAVNFPRSERSGYFEEWTAGYGIKETAGYLIDYQQKNPDEKIVVGTEGYFGTLPDGLQIYLNEFSEITVIGVGIDLAKMPQSLIDSKQFGNNTYLLINDTRLLFDPAKEDLNLVTRYEKALKPNGTREELLLFGLK